MTPTLAPIVTPTLNPNPNPNPDPDPNPNPNLNPNPNPNPNQADTLADQTPPPARARHGVAAMEVEGPNPANK